MKIAVFGATGFIGQHLCDACVERGDSVKALVRKPEAGAKLAQRGVSVVRGDLTDRAVLLRVCEGSEIVFNVAGALGKWGKSSEELEIVNASAPGVIVNCAAQACAGKVVHTSTAGVSGPLPDGFDAGESDEPSPSTEYQKTKLEGESSAIKAHRERGIPLVIARPAFVYGPGDAHKLSLFRMVAAGRMVLVNRGKSRLHPAYVDDVVRGLLACAEHGKGDGEVYIIAGERPATTKELVETIARTLAVRPPRVSFPEGLLLGLAGVAEAVGSIMHKEPPITRSKVKLFSENYAYTIKKAESELGFSPSVGVAEGIARTVKWYESQGLMR